MKKLSIEEIAKEEKIRVQRIEQESRPKERFVKLTFLIATEGTQTEPNYLFQRTQDGTRKIEPFQH